MRPFVQLNRAVPVLRNDPEKNIPDVIGNFPNAAAGDRPYLEGQMKSVRTVNFYNRMDYALNIWLMNNATKPDNLDGAFPRDTSFDYKRLTDQGQEGAGTAVKTRSSFTCKIAGDTVTLPFPESSSTKPILEKEESARARSCVFSFLVPTRSLAVGQLDMGDHVRKNVNLAEPTFGYDKTHYYHSKQFRSNVTDEYEIWRLVKEEIDLKDVTQKTDREVLK